MWPGWSDALIKQELIQKTSLVPRGSSRQIRHRKCEGRGMNGRRATKETCVAYFQCLSTELKVKKT